MAGVFAEREAAVVAHNIARDITGKGNLRPTTDPVNASSRPVAVRPGSAAATSTQSQRLRSSSPRWIAAGTSARCSSRRTGSVL